MNHISDTAAELSARAMRKMQRAPFERLTDGSDAWGQLAAAARSGSKRGGAQLDDQDFARIAAHAWVEFQRLKPLITKKYTLTGFTQLAFGAHHTSSKELSVVMLPPGADAARRGIRKSIRAYYLLVKAMAEVSGEGVSGLADVILRGTKLHPLTQIDAGTLSILEAAHAMLQTIVDRVDQKYGLLKLYQQTAAAKAAGIDAGSYLNWPFDDLEPPKYHDESYLAHYREEREAAIDPGRAFWRLSEWFGLTRQDGALIGIDDCRLLRNPAFFFVPHAHLGYVVGGLDDRREDPASFDVELQKTLAAIHRKQHDIDLDIYPADEWDAVGLKPAGQADPRETNSLQYHFWIIAYPDLATKKLIPCLYMPNAEEGAPYLIPLGIETLSMLQRFSWISPTGCQPAFDRLADLLTDCDENGACSIAAGLDRSGPWLQHNPILKQAVKAAHALDRLHQAIRTLMSKPIPSSLQANDGEIA